MNDERIINKAYSKGKIHPQPCSQCGVVECATCLDEVKYLMKQAREDELQKKIANTRREFCEKENKEAFEKYLAEYHQFRGYLGNHLNYWLFRKAFEGVLQ